MDRLLESSMYIFFIVTSAVCLPSWTLVEIFTYSEIHLIVLTLGMERGIYRCLPVQDLSLLSEN